MFQCIMFHSSNQKPLDSYFSEISVKLDGNATVAMNV